MGRLIRALANMQTITRFKLLDQFTSAFYKMTFDILSKLPLRSLRLVLDDDLTKDDIDSLTSFSYSINIDIEYEIKFIDRMIQRVSILKSKHVVRRELLMAISERLAQDTSTVEILKIDTSTSLALLGEALKTNTRLKSLVFIKSSDEPLTPILDALVINSSLLKLVSYIHEGDQASLIRMLRTNTMLEILDLDFDNPMVGLMGEMTIFSNEYSDEFVSALNRSSLVDLTLRIHETHNIDGFFIKLFMALKTNTTIKHLRLFLDHPITIDAKIIVTLLTNNTMLETFYINHMRVTNEHRLDALVGNHTLLDVSSKGPEFLINIAARNLSNKPRRDATLFGLSARQFL